MFHKRYGDHFYAKYVEFLQKCGYIETRRLYFFKILPLVSDKCSIKTTVRKSTNLNNNPYIYIYIYVWQLIV